MKHFITSTKIFSFSICIVAIGLLTNVRAADQEIWQEVTDAQESNLKQLLIEESNLKDPFSVQFRKVYRQSAKGVVCGQLNAKNSQGAYTGWSRFAAAGDAGVLSYVLIENADRPSSEIDKMCKGHPSESARQEPVANKEECTDQNGTLYQAKVQRSSNWPFKKQRRLFVSECKTKNIKALVDFCNRLNAENLSWEPATGWTVSDFLASKDVDYKGTLVSAGYNESRGIPHAIVATNVGKNRYISKGIEEYYLSEAHPVLCITKSD